MYMPASKTHGIIICLFLAPINLLSTGLRVKLRLAPHAPSPSWHAFQLLSVLTCVLHDQQDDRVYKTVPCLTC